MIAANTTIDFIKTQADRLYYTQAAPRTFHSREKQRSTSFTFTCIFHVDTYSLFSRRHTLKHIRTAGKGLDH